MLPLMPIAPPPASAVGYALTALQTIVVATSFGRESGPDATPYSKFAIDKPMSAPISSKQGMLLIYSPALVYCAAVGLPSALNLGSGANGREMAVAAALLFHFAKRVAETLFVHRYSGTTETGVAAGIGVYYALVCALVVWSQASVPAAAVSAAGLPLGAALFGLGEAGNAYHHWLLRQLRDSGDTSYAVPTGGLFPLVAAPHYLFELVAWAGIAVLAQQANSVLVVASMASYLGGRAAATSGWYRSKLGSAYPSERRHIIPFIF